MRWSLQAFALAAGLFFAPAIVPGSGPAPAHAVQPDEVLPDAGQEQRARALSAGLRCMVCQNQSIDDSDAPLARDLRLLVRARIVAGDSDAEVIDYLVSRYGEFVLLQPRFGIDTVLLWGLPALLLAGGGVFLWLSIRQRRRLTPQAALSREEEKRIEELLARRDRA